MITTYLIIDKTETGKHIKELISKSDFSIRDLQQYLGFTTVHPIYYYMSGRNLPSLDNLVLISHLLKITINDILICKEIEINPQEY